MANEEIELITQFPRVMHMLKRNLMSGFICSKEDLNFNPTQRLVLFLTNDNKRLTMTELHKFTGLEKGSLTTVIDQLIKKGLVKRSGDEKDRRKIYVSLTQFGQKQISILHEEVSEFVKKQLDRLSPQQRKKFYMAIKIFKETSECLS